MFRKLGFLAVVAIMVTAMPFPAWCGNCLRRDLGDIGSRWQRRPANGRGGGSPRFGRSGTLKVFTDDHGFYSVASLLPGTYSVKVSAPSFLPSLREKIDVRAGAKLMVNVTLTTLFEAIQLVPLRSPVDDDDWKWTLRSMANRPILRVLEDGTTVVAQSGESAADHDLKGALSFVAGSPGQGFGSPSDMNAGFAVERSLLSSGTVRLNGNVGYGADGQSIPAAVLRTTYTDRFNGVFEPSLAITALRLNSPDRVRDARRRAGSAVGDQFRSDRPGRQTGDEARQRIASHPVYGAGARLQALRVGRSAHHSEYRAGISIREFGPEHATGRSFGDGRFGDDGLNSTSSDLSETAPRMSMTGFLPAVERARHQEVSISQRIGKNNMQVAFYSDSMVDPALTGVGEMLPGAMTAESGEVLPDVYSGTFSYQGNDYATRGMRVVLQRKLLSDLTATLDYAYGGVLDLSRPDVQLQDAREWIRAEQRHAVAAKFSGTVPKAKTYWVASYRYTGGHQALTPVDLFDSSPGQADPYLNLFIRQPIPASFLAGHMEVLMDLRNLLAQGYVPVMGRDGRTLYLVQSARSVRGGVAFSF